MRILKFSEAIREAQDQCLSQDKSVFVIGEGVGDPKNVFGTTFGLKDKHPLRIFDMPISENGMTGVCIGAAINGFKPVLVHQRIDFSLYSVEQIVNNAAKWSSMFGGISNCPFVVRMIVGRGFGQGNQHSQNLTPIYAHVPGLKIVVPSNAYNAKGLFISAVKDPNPVLFIEHRWLYETTTYVPEEMFEVPFSPIIRFGLGFKEQMTIVSSGHATAECKKAVELLNDKDIFPDHVDLICVKPLEIDKIVDSFKKTKKLLVVMDEWEFGGIAAEVIAQIACCCPGGVFKRLTYPNYPSGSSPALTKNYYPEAADVAQAVQNMLGYGCDIFPRREPHDVPDPKMFLRGPF